jgi:hypothetical protein
VNHSLAVEQEMRRRVDRMLNAGFDKYDFSAIVHFLRGRWHGRDCAREIAHFLAHPEQRDQGIVTDAARDFFTVIRFKAPLLAAGTNALNVSCLPSLFPSAVKRTLGAVEKSLLRKNTGISPMAAKDALARTLAKLNTNPDGTYAIKVPLTPEEARLIGFLAGIVVSMPAFTDTRLVNDLWFLLVKNKLAKESEKAAFAKLRSAIILFAVCCMHQRTILLEEEPGAQLSATCNHNADLPFQVVAVASGGIKVQFATPMFVTNLIAKEYCTLELIADAQAGWDYPIELSPELKLRRL